MIKTHDKNEAQRSFEEVKKFNKIISDNPNMSSEVKKFNKIISDNPNMSRKMNS